MCSQRACMVMWQVLFYASRDERGAKATQDCRRKATTCKNASSSKYLSMRTKGCRGVQNRRTLVANVSEVVPGNCSLVWSPSSHTLSDVAPRWLQKPAKEQKNNDTENQNAFGNRNH
eukprot:2633593-Amphidinium_carterae.2